MADQKLYDSWVYKYLTRKGYSASAAALSEEANVAPLSCIRRVYSQVSSNQPLHTILLYEPGDNLPSKFDAQYMKLCEFADGALDAYKPAYRRLVYPIFIHQFFELVRRGYPKEAAKHFEKYSPMHRELFSDELRAIQGIANEKHIEANETAQKFIKNKYKVAMSKYAFDLLLRFLHAHDHMLMIHLIIEHVHLIISPQDLSEAEIGDDGLVDASLGDTPEEQEKARTLNDLPEPFGILKNDPSILLYNEKMAEAEKLEVVPGTDEPTSKKMKKVVAKELKDVREQMQTEAAKDAGVVLNAPRVESKVPLPLVSDKEQAAELEELRKRVRLAPPSALPSVCFYTVCNAYGTLNCSALSADGSSLLCGFDDSAVKLWHMDGRQPVQDLKRQMAGQRDGDAEDASAPQYTLFRGHYAPVYGVDFCPDMRTAISGSADNTVRLWSVDTGTNVVVYKGHNFPVWDVKFCPQGYYFASASHDRTARIWAMDKVTPLRILVGHLADVDTVEWHVNCNYVATGSSDKSVRLWDIQTGECVRVLVGHRNAVTSMAFSPDGLYLASAGEEGNILMWDLGSGRKISTLSGHTGPVHSLAYCGGGQVLASGGSDCTVKIWDVSKTESQAQASQKNPKSGNNPGKLKQIRNLKTKNTPVYNLRFSRRNLLMATGPFQRQS